MMFKMLMFGSALPEVDFDDGTAECRLELRSNFLSLILIFFSRFTIHREIMQIISDNLVILMNRALDDNERILVLRLAALLPANPEIFRSAFAIVDSFPVSSQRLLETALDLLISHSYGSSLFDTPGLLRLTHRLLTEETANSVKMKAIEILKSRASEIVSSDEIMAEISNEAVNSIADRMFRVVLELAGTEGPIDFNSRHFDRRLCEMMSERRANGTVSTIGHSDGSAVGSGKDPDGTNGEERK
jgi:hypothetical protein